jgi:hypothetical protein
MNKLTLDQLSALEPEWQRVEIMCVDSKSWCLIFTKKFDPSCQKVAPTLVFHTLMQAIKYAKFCGFTDVKVDFEEL